MQVESQQIDLNDISKSFQLESGTTLGEDKVSRLVSLSKRTVVRLIYTEANNHELLELQVFDFWSFLENGGDVKKVLYNLDAEIHPDLPTHSISKITCAQVSNNQILIGYYYEIKSQTQDNTSASGIRILGFRYCPQEGQLLKFTDSIHPTDLELVSLLPCFTTSTDKGHKRLIFGSHRSRIYCIAGLHKKKQIMRIYCLYRNKFHEIGGSNCRKSGIYLFSSNQETGFMNDPCFGGLYGLGSDIKLDIKAKTMEFRFFELRLCL
jgi:hypothetical protein